MHCAQQKPPCCAQCIHTSSAIASLCNTLPAPQRVAIAPAVSALPPRLCLVARCASFEGSWLAACTVPWFRVAVEG